MIDKINDILTMIILIFAAAIVIMMAFIVGYGIWQYLFGGAMV